MDAAVSLERQNYVFGLMCEILDTNLSFENKDEARSWFYQLRQKALDYNYTEWQSETFKNIEGELRSMLAEKKAGAPTEAATAAETGE